MGLFSALFTASTVLVGIFVTRSILRIALDSHGRLPGPFWARFSRLWYLAQQYRGEFEKTDFRLHRELGPIVRIAPNQYSIDDVDAVKTIYGPGTNFLKSPWYHGWNPPGDLHDIFSDRDAKRHAENRRKIAGLYSTSTLLQYEHFIDRGVAMFSQRMTEFTQNQHSFDLQHWFQCYAFDVIALMTLDRSFGMLDNGKDDHSILHDIDSILSFSNYIAVYGEWQRIVMNTLLTLFPSAAAGPFQSFMNRVLADRENEDTEKARNTSRHDFLTKLLQMHKDDPEKITMNHVRIGCMQNIGAGSDTTSVSLASVIYHLMRNPKQLATLRQELTEAAENGTASSPITFQEAQALPYLQACIKEGLRLHPATGLPLLRVVPAGGATIAGTFFTAGSIVGINTWVAHYSETVFGPDAASFRPERWLDTKEKVSRLDQYYFPFGLGSRTCIGKNISLMEISKLVPELVKKFDFELVHPDRELETRNAWFVKQTNLEVRVKMRKAES